jgi:hypothetical protein
MIRPPRMRASVCAIARALARHMPQLAQPHHSNSRTSRRAAGGAAGRCAVSYYCSSSPPRTPARAAEAAAAPARGPAAPKSAFHGTVRVDACTPAGAAGAPVPGTKPSGRECRRCRGARGSSRSSARKRPGSPRHGEGYTTARPLRSLCAAYATVFHCLYGCCAAGQARRQQREHVAPSMNLMGTEVGLPNGTYRSTCSNCTMYDATLACRWGIHCV